MICCADCMQSVRSFLVRQLEASYLSWSLEAQPLAAFAPTNENAVAAADHLTHGPAQEATRPEKIVIALTEDVPQACCPQTMSAIH